MDSMIPLSEIQAPNSLFPIFTKEKDPSNLIVVLDKGLRSKHITEQYEALMFFSKLVHYYPHHVIINTAFMKLTELFHVGNNFVRYCILQIFEQCKEYLTKILNIEEVVKRINNVLIQTDPVARAITLRVFATMPSIIADRLNIHHGIRNCMNSPHQIEADAAIHVMDKLCAVSPVFAKGILIKIVEMIEGLSTPPPRKLQLINLLRHMHHTAELAAEARQILDRLFDLYPTKPFVLSLLDTSTSLAAFTLLQIPHQVTVLILKSRDPRRSVQLAALQHIKKLAQVSYGGHVDWRIHLPSVLELARISPYDDIRLHALLVVYTLSNIFPDKVLRCKELVVCKECACYPEISISDISIRILTNLLVKFSIPANKQEHPNLETQQLSNLPQLVCISLTTRFTSSSYPSPRVSKTSSLLHSIVQLIQHYPQYADTITDTIVAVLPQTSVEEACTLVHCMTMYIPYNHVVIYSHTDMLKKFAMRERTTRSCKLLCAIGVLFLRARVEQQAVRTFFDAVSLENSNDGKVCYVLGREALLLGYPELSIPLFEELAAKVEDEIVYFWLDGLAAIAKGETSAMVGMMGAPITNTLTELQRARTCLSSVFPSTSFQNDFVDLRISFVHAVLCLLSTLSLLPDAKVMAELPNNKPTLINFSDVMDMSGEYDEEIVEEQSGNIGIGMAMPVAIPDMVQAMKKGPISGAQQWAHFSEQARKHCQAFRDIAQQYYALQQRYSLLDKPSLDVIESHRISCSLIAYTIDSVWSSKPVATPDLVLGLIQDSNSTQKRDALYSTCKMIFDYLNETKPESMLNNGDFVNEVVSTIVRSPPVYPRFFFKYKLK